MSSNKEKMLEYLRQNKKAYCDDCLSKILQMTPRQTVYAVCTKAFNEKLIYRESNVCSYCHNIKKVSKILERFPESLENDVQPMVTNKQEKTITEESRLSPGDFEKRVKVYLEKTFSQDFKEKALVVGVNKEHKFDLVSSDNLIIAECKSYTWTKGSNMPSGKVSTALEAVFYLSRIVADKKILVFQDSIKHSGESLVDMFLKNNGGLLDDVEIWTFKVDEHMRDIVEIKRTCGETWYKNMYK
ncbi:hypothetical protein [Dehalobacter sp. TBBPA1]|uniref:hypothetical protein n=1 Tax=Dehalobacter sp. TBBPA1 TaxID=3235037 RepID=UPI0034A185CE